MQNLIMLKIPEMRVYSVYGPTVMHSSFKVPKEGPDLDMKYLPIFPVQQ